MVEFLQGERRLARIAPADRQGMPHVTPVGMGSYNPDLGTIDIGGRDFAYTKKFRNVTENPQAAMVVDDLASVNPWRPRGVMIQGPAQAIPTADRTQNQAIIRLTPETVVFWGLD